MRLPRDTDARELIQALQRIGYQVIRQTGSHIRLKAEEPKPHAITIPKRSPLKLETLSSILNDIARHRDISKEELLRLLFGQ